MDRVLTVVTNHVLIEVTLTGNRTEGFSEQAILFAFKKATLSMEPVS